MMKQKIINKSQTKRIYFVFSVLLMVLVFIFSFNKVQAATGVIVGSDQLILNNAENLYYGVMGEASNAGASGLLLQRPAGNNIFRVDPFGNVVSAGNVGGVGLCMSGDCRTSWSDVVNNFSLWKLSGSNLFASSTTWNVGIGTTAPNDKLVVSNGTGEIRFGGSNGRTLSAYIGASLANFDFRAVSTYFNSHFILAAQKQIQMYNYAGDNPNYATIYIPSNERLTFRVNSEDRMSIDSLGNVGIGVTNPLARLHIFTGTGLINEGSTRFNLLGGSGNVLVMADNTGTLYATSTSVIIPDQLWSGTLNGNIWNGAAGAGNVGIGTTSPTEKLEINGKLKVGNNTVSGENITFDAETTAGMRVQNLYGYVNITPLNAGWAHIYTDRTNFIFNRPIYSYDGAFSAYNTYDLKLQTSGTTRILVQQTSGNVGIGTTTPLAKLHVAGNMLASGSLTSVGLINSGITQLTPLGGSGNVLVMADNTGTLYATSTSVIIPDQLWSGTLNGNIWNGATGAGNVGIGTTNPIQKLDISGSIVTNSGSIPSIFGSGSITASSPSAAGTGFYTQIRDAAGSYGGYSLGYGSTLKWLYGMSKNITDTTALVFYEDGSAAKARMTIATGGNVGIGLTNPQANLHIKNGVGLINEGSTRFNLLGGSGNVLVMADNTGTLYATSSSVIIPPQLWSGTKNGNIWNGDAGAGNVGIGTTTTSSFKLNVAGDIQTNNLTFSNPGFGVDSRITFSKLTDSAWLSVKEVSSDATEYSFNMSDNPDQPGDKFYWKMSDWHGVGGAWTPLQFAGLNAQIAAANINAFGNYNVYGPWYSSDGNPNTIYSSKTGIINLTPNISGYTGTTGVYWFKIDGTGSPNTFSWGRGHSGSAAVATGVAITGGAQTIENGILVTFSATTGGALNDFWQFRVNAGGNLRVANGTAALPSLSFTGDTNTGVYLNGTDQLGISTAGVNRVIVNSAGNVGIGTTTPAAKLHVIGNILSSGSITSTGIVNSGTTQLTPLGGSGNVLVMADNTGTLYSTSTSVIIPEIPDQLWSGTLNGNIWNSDAGVGNVGIGITNPSAKLDMSSGYSSTGDTYGLRSVITPGSSINSNTHRAVYGEAIQSGYYSSGHTVVGTQGLAGRISYAGGTESIGVLGRAVYNENHKYMYPAYNSNSRMVGVKSEIDVTYTNTGTDHLKHAYGFYSKGLTVSGTTVNNWYGLYVSPTAVTSGGVITNKYGIYQEESTAVNYFAGNIGIGLTNPVANLHIKNGVGLINEGSTRFNLLGGSGQVIVMADDTGTLYATSSDALLPPGEVTLPSGILGQTLSHNGTVWVANSNLYNNNTNVGLGITNPLQKLQVNGNVLIGTGNYYPNSALQVDKTFANTSGTDVAMSKYIVGNGSGTATQYAEFTTSQINANHTASYGTYSRSLTTAGVVLGSGYGIYGDVYNNNGAAATINNAYGVYGNVNAQDGIITTGYGLYSKLGKNTGSMGTAYGLYIDLPSGIATTQWGIYANTNANIYLGTGNVGIGTSNPGARLEVNGTSRFVGGATSWYSSDGTYRGGITFGSSPVNNLRLFAASGQALILGAGGTNNHLLIKSDGNVGIGTSVPNAKLSVNGSSILGGATQVTPLGGSGNVLVMADNAGNLFATSTNIVAPDPNTLVPVSTINGETLRGNGTGWTANTNLFNNGTNVGIGTTNPQAILDVSGAARIYDSTRSNYISLSPTSNNQEIITSGGNLNLKPAGGGVLIYKESVNTSLTLRNAANSSSVLINTNGNSYFNGGDVGIGTTNPTYGKLEVDGDGASPQFAIVGNVGSQARYRFTALFPKLTIDPISISNHNLVLQNSGDGTMGLLVDGNVGIGLTNPVANLHIKNGVGLINEGSTRLNLLGGAGNAVVMTDDTGNLYSTSTNALVGDYLPLAGGTMSGDINMGGNDIQNINKLTVNTIDPLYRIKGINYSTFASSIVGGVKEEFVGKAEIKKLTLNGEYEFVIDFNSQKEGSDLWVWRKIVDFNKENVDALITNYGNFSQVYYLIEGEKIIFRASKPTSISYRLIGRRHDWREWPTRAIDQTEKAGFIIN